MADPVPMLTLQFLEWIALAPRSYREVMEAWRTSCPRLPVWEEAVEGALVRIDHRSGAVMADSAVVITPAGRALLQAAAVDA